MKEIWDSLVNIFFSGKEFPIIRDFSYERFINIIKVNFKNKEVIIMAYVKNNKVEVGDKKGLY